MEFEKIYSQKFYDFSFISQIPLVSYHPKTKIKFLPQTGEIIINGKSYIIPNFENRYTEYKVFNMSPSYSILSMDWYVYNDFYLITITEDEVSFQKMEGEVVYISQVGFIRKINDFSECTDINDTNVKVTFQAYNILTKEWGSCDLFGIPETNCNIRKYFISIFQRKEAEYYIVPLFWLTEFKKYNPEFPNPEKNYFVKEPSQEEIPNKICTVHFKDKSVNLESSELKELKSDFINEQLLHSDIYLDFFTYEEYQKQTYKFLDYISSYKLHLHMKEEMIEELKIYIDEDLKIYHQL